MAELLEFRRQRGGLPIEQAAVARPTAIDPTCGMPVDVATARYRSERDGATYYFCCAGCQKEFLAS
jgi:YHS domain-containing protein